MGVHNPVRQTVSKAFLKSTKVQYNCLPKEKYKSIRVCKTNILSLDCGIIPESWSSGIIKPVYKNKGNPSVPHNFRAITLISCVGKLFTSILNSRLKINNGDECFKYSFKILSVPGALLFLSFLIASVISNSVILPLSISS
jgi:hypothetical protein